MTVVVEVPSDECDACPAKAHVKAFLYAELPNGGTLAYCAHHGTTPHGWAPKYRTAHNGKWTEGAWDA